MTRVRVSPGVYREVPEPRTTAKKPTAKKSGSKKPTDALTSAQRRRQNAALQAGKESSAVSNLTQNANVEGPFGSSTVTVDPVTGQATQTTSMSPTEQGKYDASSGLYTSGVGKARGIVDNMGAFQPGDPTQLRQKAFDTAYDYMTRNMARDKQREQADLEQRLYNRGIPIDPDDSQYKKWMGDLNERYDTQARDFASQAYMASGTEADRMYGQEQGTYNTNLGAAGQLSSLGTGVQVPQAPGVQGSAVQTQDPSVLGAAMAQTAAENKLKKAQTAYYGRPRGGSSSSGSVADEGFGYTTG